jgi:putative membrane protein
MKPYLRPISRSCAAAFAAASLCTAVLAQVTPTPTMTPDTPTSDSTKDDGTGLSHHDRGFLKKAARAGMKEVIVSQAVMDNLANPKVKELAQMMIADHTVNNTELMSLASSKSVPLPPQDTSIADEWSKKTGDVDAQYVKEMVSDHKAAVELFEKASKSNNPDIAAFASKTLPTLQHHLSMAEALDQPAN